MSEVKSLFPVGKSLSFISSNEDRIQIGTRILSSPSARFVNGAEIAVRGNVQVANNRPLAKVLLIKFWNGQDARSTRKNVFCGMGILPVLVIFARGLISKLTHQEQKNRVF